MLKFNSLVFSIMGLVLFFHLSQLAINNAHLPKGKDISDSTFQKVIRIESACNRSEDSLNLISFQEAINGSTKSKTKKYFQSRTRLFET